MRIKKIICLSIALLLSFSFFKNTKAVELHKGDETVFDKDEFQNREDYNKYLKEVGGKVLMNSVNNKLLANNSDLVYSTTIIYYDFRNLKSKAAIQNFCFNKALIE